ncbi:hypothetical protein N7528_009340 [Penicillium herquei]|nr:hypothetical protein N7528_009340 [Penicillium herquei]
MHVPAAKYEQLTGQDADSFGEQPPPAGTEALYSSSDSHEREHFSTVRRPRADAATLSNDAQALCCEKAALDKHSKYHRKKMKGKNQITRLERSGWRCRICGFCPASRMRFLVAGSNRVLVCLIVDAVPNYNLILSKHWMASVALHGRYETNEYTLLGDDLKRHKVKQN